MIRLLRAILSKRYHVFLIAFVCVAVGALSAFHIRMTQMPHAEFPRVDIVGVYPNATQLTLRQTIAEPIQDRIKKLDHVETVRVSVSDAVYVAIQFRYGTDAVRAEREVKALVAQVRRPLPRSVKFTVKRARISERLISFVVGVSAKPGTSPDSLFRVASELEHQIALIDGTRGVQLLTPPKEISVTLKPGALRQSGLSVSDISTAFDAANQATPAGITPIGTQWIDTRYRVSIDSFESLSSLLISSARHPVQLPLRDIATVALTVRPERRQIVTIDGQPALLIQVKTTSTAKLSLIKREILRQIDRANKTGDTQSKLLYDESGLVKRDLSELALSFLIGFGILIAVLIAFMGVRSGVIAAITMPLSVLFTIAVLPATGHWLHAVSISGLIIAMGIIVDNGVVVAESVDAFSDRTDLSAMDKAIYGAASVAVPLLTSTLSTIFAFSTILFLTTEEGIFIRSLAVTIITALVGSYVIAILFATLLLALIQPNRGSRRWQFRSIFEWVAPYRDRYLPPVIRYAILHPFQIIGLILVLFGIALPVAQQIPAGDMPAESTPYFYVDITNTNRVTIDQTANDVEPIARALMQHPDVRHVTTVVGGNFPQIHLSMLPIRETPNNARIVVETRPMDIAARTRLLAQLNDRYRTMPNGVSVTFQAFTRSSSGSIFPISVYLKGFDRNALFTTSDWVASAVRQIPGVRRVINRSIQSDPYRVQLSLDMKSLAAHHADYRDTMAALQSVTGGLPVSQTVLPDGTAYPVVVRADRDQSSLSQAFSDIPILSRSPNGTHLSLLVNQQIASPDRLLQYHNHTPTVILDIELASGASETEVQRKIETVLSKRPASVTVLYKGKLADRSGNTHQIIVISAIAIFSIYALFAIEFRSFIRPVYVMLAVPLSLIGGIYLLFWSGDPLSTISLLGFTSLFGLAVNDAVLLVDRSSQEIQTEKELLDACVDAAVHRFFPVVLTSVTTIVGLLPLIPGEQLFRPLAMVTIGGLITSTILLLVVIPPVIYWSERRRRRRYKGASH